MSGGTGPVARVVGEGAEGPQVVALPRGARRGATDPAPSRSMSSMSSMSGGATNYLLWQNTTTGDRGFWPISGGAPAGGWMPLASITPTWNMACTADFDGDGNHDVLWQNTSTGEWGFWLLDGTGVSSRGYIPLTQIDVQWKVVGCADVTGDGTPDLLWRNASTGDLGFWKMLGTGPDGSGYTPLTTIDAAWQVAALADFSGDGKPDILWQNLTTGDRGFWTLNGTAVASGWTPLTNIAGNWVIRLAADANGDGQSDILWHNTTTGERGWWYLSGMVPTNGWTPLTTIGNEWDMVGLLPAQSPITVSAANALGVSDGFACAIDASGAPWCWGRNNVGQLGDGTLTNRSTPVRVVRPTGGFGHALRFTQIATGYNTTCALAESQQAYCWGSNFSGQVGDGTKVARSVPTLVQGGLQFTSVTVGNSQSCGLTASGAAYCWGLGRDGILGTGDTVSTTTPRAVTGGLTFASISASFFGTCGVTAAGAAYCWGQNPYGNLGVSSVNAKYFSPTAVTGGLAFTQFHIAVINSCGVAGGAAYCWGREYNAGGLGQGAPTTATLWTPTAVTGGLSFAEVHPSTGNNIFSSTCGLTTTGAAYCWGPNDYGQLGSSTALPSCSFNNGTTTYTFPCSATPVAVSGGRTYSVLRTGREAACAVSGSTLYCWGRNDQGQLGVAPAGATTYPTPTAVPGLVMP
jgi:alpha-tubulin suppressor-like RCC1 family protein